MPVGILDSRMGETWSKATNRRNMNFEHMSKFKEEDKAQNPWYDKVSKEF